MKELSIEEKAQRYDEALKVAKAIRDGKAACIPNGTHVTEAIFPELKESEDVRIRKECISIIDAWDKACKLEGNYCEVASECISWLEKQGKQKQEWSEEDENGFGDALWAIKQAKTIAKDENDMGTLWYAERWLNSIKDRVWSNQGEQKAAERKDFISIPFGAYDSELVNKTITIPDGCTATIDGNIIHINKISIDKEDKEAPKAINEETDTNTAKDSESNYESTINVGDWVIREDGWKTISQR